MVLNNPTGLFHVQDLTWNEPSKEITCSFAEFSNARGCLLMVICSDTVNNSEVMDLNALCDIMINKTGSKSASIILPARCFDEKACPALDIFAYDVHKDGTVGKTVAKSIRNISNINPYCSSCTTTASDPMLSVILAATSNTSINEGSHKYICL